MEIQSLDQGSCKKAVITGSTKPYNSLHGLCVNMSHQLYLGSLFIWIVLTNAYSVNPDPAMRVSRILKSAASKFLVICK